MRRREFIAGLGGAAAWPLALRAQQRALPVTGLLGQDALETAWERMASFYRGMVETGYAEGRNVAIEYRCATGKMIGCLRSLMIWCSVRLM
jgi:putative tryptophan/tyrosine transport system substrate-binding protein